VLALLFLLPQGEKGKRAPYFTEPAVMPMIR
jgi:hypothetical protein